jgi:hypothetical protein
MMGYRIKVSGKSGAERVSGWPTSNPHIWVTRSLDDKSRFTVTHRSSGKALAHNMETREMADIAANVFAQFPIDWSADKPDPKNFKDVLIDIRTAFNGHPR